MKRNDAELSKLKNILAHNKFGSNDKFENLFFQDLNSVLRDYFNVSGEPLISIEKKQGGYTVNVAFNADSIKKVNSISD